MIFNEAMDKSAQSFQSQTVVVKLGTSVLTGGTLALDEAQWSARACAELKKQGHSIELVSSAIAAGREHLASNLPTHGKQTIVAAVGQSQLIQTWEC